MVLKFTIRILSIVVICLQVFPSTSLNAQNARCGTFLIEDNPELLKKDNLINKVQGGDMQKTCLSPSGKFLIHYDIANTDTSKNAVPSEDKNDNGIPDFVDSSAYYLDKALDFYTLELGYKSPYPDDNTGGSEAYDVYMIDLSSFGYYGYTKPGKKISDSGIYPRNYSYIAIDNDYSPLDSVEIYGGKVQTYKYYSPYEFIKITTAHELHHAIQFLYGRSPDKLLYEMTSTYFEIRLYPEIPDYVQFVKNLLNNPELYPFGKGITAETGYRYAIFGYYLYQQFGDTVLKSMFELVSNDVNTYLALDQSLKKVGSGLNKAWCEFLAWLYYTGKRTIPGQYFTYADKYPEFLFKPDIFFAPPSYMIDESLYSYEFKAFRIVFPIGFNSTADTLDIIVTNKDLNAAVHNLFEPGNKLRYNLVAQNSESANYTRMGTSDYYYNMTLESDDMCYTAIQRNGLNAVQSTIVFPNPFRCSTDSELFFPVPDNAGINDNVALLVYNSAMDVIYHEKFTVSAYNSHKGIVLQDIPQGWNTGTYIFQTKFGSKELSGKFGIIK